MKKNYLLYVILIVWVTLTIADMFATNRKFSDLENRNLKTKVTFSLTDFFNNKFQKEYETYINDQFVFRDSWIDLKARGEYLLAKVENNGIILGNDEYLFEKFSNYDEERILNNILSINILKEKIEVPMSTMLVPNSYMIYEENLPKYAPMINQEKVMKDVYNEFNDINNINLLDIMKKNKDDYIYYRTDHHWTTYGAYLAYVEFIKSIGDTPVELSTLDRIKVDNFYGTYFSKAKPFNVEADYLEYYNLDEVEMEIYGENYNSLYDYSKLKLRDKYAFFLRGNNALTVIKNNNLKNGKKICVIKDSYANSFVPFLTQNYEEVHVIDLRTFMEKIDKYINGNDFEQVLILYNFINFTRDTNIIKLKY